MTNFTAPISRINISEAVDESRRFPADNESGEQGSRKPDSAAAGLSSSKLLRNIRGIIFDFDGTLFDNAMLPFRLISAYPPDIFRLWRERLVRKQFTGCDFSTPKRYYRAFFVALGKACRRSPEKMRNWYFNRYMPRMTRVLKRHYKFRDGVTELFRRFDAQTTGTGQTKPRVAIYSDYPFLKERLDALGLVLSPKIVLYGPESFGAQKPAPRPYNSIAADLGIAPEEVLVIGDREETDGLGAFRAGMRFFCLETGHRRYFLLDPYRRPSDIEGPHGPSLLIHAGTWDDLVKLLMEKF